MKESAVASAVGACETHRRLRSGYDAGDMMTAAVDLLRRFFRALRDCAVGLMMPTTST
jgi:hypothetical protein